MAVDANLWPFAFLMGKLKNLQTKTYDKAYFFRYSLVRDRIIGFVRGE